MAHETAKALLRQADGLSQRMDAIRAALAMGMPLTEIEAYLDWLDFNRQSPPGPTDHTSRDRDHPR
jgi:DNA-binding transcriptional MerR regulator